MKLYYSPGACSLGIHIVLEETGTTFDLVRIMLASDQQKTPEYQAVNPKGKVPALVRDDGSLLTEYGAIATWLARTNPQAGLIPPGAEDEARMVETVDYVVGTIHAQGYARFARPGNFAPEDAKAMVQARGREIFARGMATLAERLDGRDWVAGSYSLGDPAVFYVTRWASRIEVEVPALVAAHAARMRARPAVQRALASEGLVS